MFLEMHMPHTKAFSWIIFELLFVFHFILFLIPKLAKLRLTFMLYNSALTHVPYQLISVVLKFTLLSYYSRIIFWRDACNFKTIKKIYFDIWSYTFSQKCHAFRLKWNIYTLIWIQRFHEFSCDMKNWDPLHQRSFQVKSDQHWVHLPCKYIYMLYKRHRALHYGYRFGLLHVASLVIFNWTFGSF